MDTNSTLETILTLAAIGGLVAPVAYLMERTNRRERREHGARTTWTWTRPTPTRAGSGTRSTPSTASPTADRWPPAAIVGEDLVVQPTVSTSPRGVETGQARRRPISQPTTSPASAATAYGA